ncbi:MAG: YidC/Oxa1 family membrane protein insertase [Coriobacteriia bacterium]|nr:YidC/Oxa1 family membrane protein insertase [Coriobacteriia bacterium]
MRAVFYAFLELIFGAMQMVHSLVGDWGISIIAITIFFRLLIWPLMVKQVRGMRGMQKLQPQIKEIQKKYADDRETQSQKMMELYRENNVNPMGSCLPMFAQMPLLIGFFAVIMIPPVDGDGIVQPIGFYNWIFGHDGIGPLAQSLGYIAGEAPPVIPTEYLPTFFNILPNITLTPAAVWETSQIVAIPYIVLLLLSSVAILIPMLLQQKNMQGPQAQQSKMIGYVMAVFMTFIGWSFFSGGVLLYLTTSSLFAAGQQFIVQRGMEKEEEAEEAAIEEAKRKKKAERKKGSKNKGAVKKH